MQYKILKMAFQTSVHFGQGNLHKSQNVLYADTIFSALCMEAVKIGADELNWLIDAVKSDRLRISDGLPYIGEQLYVPKPLMKIEMENQGDSTVKKAVKKLNYVPANQMKDYLNGKMDIAQAGEAFSGGFGSSEVLTKAVIEDEGTTPYFVGTYTYKDNSGLYVIIGYMDDEILGHLLELFEAVGYNGIGGRVSSGLGKFEGKVVPMPAYLEQKMAVNGSKKKHKYMSLAVSLPTMDEMESIMENASFSMVKRSGFVASERYAQTLEKKKDLYVLAAGSVFTSQFDGDLYDVSDGGAHAVYRYAKPMLMEVI